MARSHEGHDDAVILLAAVVESRQELESLPAKNGEEVEHELLCGQALRSRPWLVCYGKLDVVVQHVLLVAYDLSRAVEQVTHASCDFGWKAIQANMRRSRESENGECRWVTLFALEFASGNEA